MATTTDESHPSLAELLSVLHQQPVPDAAAIRLHTARCETCANRWRDLADADSNVSNLLDRLDHPLPRWSDTRWLRPRPRQLRRALLTAGAAVGLAAAAAATILPGWPVRRWLDDRNAPPPRAASVDASTVPVPSTVDAAALASGIAVPATRELVVEFRRESATGVIDLARSQSTDASFRSRGGLTAYEVKANRVIIDNRMPADTYFIDFPAAVRQLRVLMAGRTVLRWPADSVQLAERGHAVAQRVVLDLSRLSVP